VFLVSDITAISDVKAYEHITANMNSVS